MVWTAAANSAWAFGWEALVAIGTLGLAIATGALASSTRGLARKTAEEVEQSARQVEASLQQVEVAQQQAEAAQQALQSAHAQARLAQLTLNAQIRPVLIDVPGRPGVQETIRYPDTIRAPSGEKVVHGDEGVVHVAASDAEVLISVPLRNAGNGLAMIRGLNLALHIEIGQPPVRIDPPNVPPTEHARVSFRAVVGDAAFSPLSQSIRDRRDFSIQVGYSDLAGEQYTVTRLDLYCNTSGHWYVRQVHLEEPGSDVPFAGSAPAA